MCVAYHNVSLLEFNIQKFYTHDLFDIVEMCKRIEFNHLYFKVLFEKKYEGKWKICDKNDVLRIRIVKQSHTVLRRKCFNEMENERAIDD